MTPRERHLYHFVREGAALARSRIALAHERTLTHFGPSDILHSSPFAHREATRIAHACSAAHLPAPQLPFNSQVPR